jgi:hypothetical protein
MIYILLLLLGQYLKKKIISIIKVELLNNGAELSTDFLKIWRNNMQVFFFFDQHATIQP